MCQNVNKLYFKIAAVTLVSIILGIISGILWQSFFTRPMVVLFTQLAASVIALVIVSVYLLFYRDNGSRNNQGDPLLKQHLRFLIFGSIGSLIISVIGLSVTLSSALLSSVIFGVATAFYALLIGGIVLTLDHLTSQG